MTPTLRLVSLGDQQRQNVPGVRFELRMPPQQSRPAGVGRRASVARPHLSERRREGAGSVVVMSDVVLDALTVASEVSGMFWM